MPQTRSPFHLLSAATHTRRGFTLLEILVAVGAVALVSVGIAAIFDSVGKTVNTGRRMSRNQMIAARVEHQLRKDFSQITRDGFLLIRQQSASELSVSNNTQGFEFAVSSTVALSDKDVDLNKATRDRRVDEIMFFAKGNFTSVMEPLSQDYIAKSTEAAIYYGHGQRRSPSMNEPGQSGVDARTPRLDDDISLLTGVTRRDGADLGLGMNSIINNQSNPNRFASDWILLRKPTLLVQPSGAISAKPIPAEITDAGLSALLVRDTDIQIALQPAASSIFQRLSRIYPYRLPTQAAVLDSGAVWADMGPSGLNPMPSTPEPFSQSAAYRPQISSGLVDIATTDCSEIQRLVTTCPVRPTQVFRAFDINFNNVGNVIAPGNYDSTNVFPDPAYVGNQPWQFPVGSGIWTGGNETNWIANATNPVNTAQGLTLLRMHSWMQNALPNRSDGFTAFYDITNGDERQPGSRARCESAWTSRDNVIPVTDATGTPPDTLAAYFKRRNQLALSAHNFLEHCSEFMVEWSFGLTDPRTGQTIWYGTPIQGSVGSDQAREMTLFRGDEVDPVDPNSLPANFDATKLPYNPFTGIASLPVQLKTNPAFDIDANANTAYRVSKHLIYGNLGAFEPNSFRNPENTDGCFTSHFGYFDPSFNPKATIPGSIDTYESKGISSLPWAWPKMVRITVRVADETDPTLEESFQFVIDLPPTPRP